jgi:putative nucleotidyltransferase with HDIG domain
MSAALDFKRKIFDTRDLPPLPVIAQKILCLADNDETAAEKLARIISSDPALAARILRLANAAYFGHRATISTIPRAISIIGLNMLKQLSFGVIVFSSVSPDRRSHKDFWKHSVKTGTAASLIAQRARVRCPEVCFMGGLLHDIGRLILEMQLPQECQQVKRLAQAEHLPLFQAERRLLETDHAEVGAWLAQRWQLPQHLVAGIAHHHDTIIETQPDADIVATVNAANICATITQDQSGHANNDVAIRYSAAAILGLTEIDYAGIVADLKERQWQIDQFLTS